MSFVFSAADILHWAEQFVGAMGPLIVILAALGLAMWALGHLISSLRARG